MKIEILNDGDLTCFKGTATLVEEKELETFDNYIHEITEEYCKMTFKEKDQILTQRLIKKQEEEIERLNKDYKTLKELQMKTNEENERLNNIINELEKYLLEYSQDLEFRCYADTFLDKLKELKEKSD